MLFPKPLDPLQKKEVLRKVREEKRNLKRKKERFVKRGTDVGFSAEQANLLYDLFAAKANKTHGHENLQPREIIYGNQI